MTKIALIPVSGETLSFTLIIPGQIRHVTGQGGCSLKKPDIGKVIALPPGMPFNLSHLDLILGKITR